MPTFDFKRFELKIIDANIFFTKYHKVDLKFRDPEGYFGAKNYDYFVYGCKQDIKQFGSSKINLMIHNRKSLEHMRKDIKDSIKERMKNFGFDLDAIEKNDQVIVAVDEHGLIGRGSASVYFTPYQGEKGEQENG